MKAGGEEEETPTFQLMIVNVPNRMNYPKIKSMIGKSKNTILIVYPNGAWSAVSSNHRVLTCREQLTFLANNLFKTYEI